MNLKEEKLQYRDLARLLPITKKMEHHLMKMGGEGKGLWERADSIKVLFPDSEKFMQNILDVAEVRNNAMHGDPKIDDIDVVLEKAQTLSTQISSVKRKRDLSNIPNLLWTSILGLVVWVFDWIVAIVSAPFILVYYIVIMIYEWLIEFFVHLYELAIELSILALKIAFVAGIFWLIFKMMKS